VRNLAQSGVRLTSISQSTAQSLIELQAEIVTDALTDAAEQMQRIVFTSSVRDLAREQAGVLQAAQQRIVSDIARAVTILKDAAGDVRKVASRATAAEPVAGKKPVRRRAKPKVARKASKTKRPVRRAKVKARAKAKARAKGGTRRARRT
jgi:phasin family protein